MEFKPKNRDWVKNAAIIFLLVLLVLTFFSNTILNRTLPEVATQYVTDGAITAKVRGTGTVAANGTTQVKADQTREIRAVMIKVGQEISAGDVLFVLGAGSSEELEAAQETLRQLQVSYQKTAINMPTPDYSSDERRLKNAKTAMDDAKAAMDTAFNNIPATDKAEIKKAEENLAAAEAGLAQAQASFAASQQAALDRVTRAQAELDRLQALKDSAAQDPSVVLPEDIDAQISAAKKELSDAKTALALINETEDPSVVAAKSLRDQCKARLDALNSAVSSGNAAYQTAKTAYDTAAENYYTLADALAEKKAADEKSKQLAYIDLSDIGTQINNQKKKIRELSGGEENEITATVSGTVATVDCTSGDTKAKGDLLCSIEVPDMGYTLSFSVTSDQAKRLKVGDTATVSNYYWGSQIVATLTTIKIDPKNPQTSKILTFDLTGDVNTGAELTISVGQKSANYDVIVPNSSIRSDTNGSFVLKIEAKNSPLGNRYIARRVDVEVLAADDLNSAVTGDLSYGDYVITTSNAPIKTGDQVRMADS